MARKININRILFVTFWCIVGGGVCILLGAAVRNRNAKSCKGYDIDISGPSSQIERSEAQFIGKKDIEALLASDGGKIRGRSVQTFDLGRLEATLERNPWIRDAQLFFDNNDILRVNVIEREPVARVFTVEGRSFYLDSAGVQLPLTVRLAAKLPVFTNYPAIGDHPHGKDSAVADQVRKLGAYIRSNAFWMAQIAQIDITSAGTFEMTPVIGNHLIGFGDGSNYEDKFRRLFVFYKEVLSRTGFDKYARVDVAYAGQVVGTRKGSEGNRFDSIEAIRNIQQMISRARQLQPDSLHQQDVKPLERSTVTEQTLTNYDLIPDKGDSAPEPAGARTTTPAASPAAPASGARPTGNKPGNATPAGAKPAGPKPAAVRPAAHRPAATHGATGGGQHGNKPGQSAQAHRTESTAPPPKPGAPVPRAVMPARTQQ